MLPSSLGTIVERIGDGATRVRRRVYPFDVLVRAGQEFQRDNGMVFAAAMSYYVLFSLFPLLIFVVVVFGLVVRDPAIQQQVVDAIMEQIPPGLTIRTQVENVIGDLAEASSPLLAIAGLIGTAWTASGMFAVLRRALNTAFDVPQARSFIIGRLMDMLILPLVMLMALLSIGATALVQVVQAFFSEHIGRTTLISVAWNITYFLMPYIISFFVFMLIYRLIPNHRLPYRYVAVGAAIAAVGFEVAKIAFSLYVINFGRYQEIYGTLGGLVAFLFFVFIVANIVIFAAEVASEVAKDSYQGEQTGRFSAYRRG
jgi:membrane protein